MTTYSATQTQDGITSILSLYSYNGNTNTASFPNSFAAGASVVYRMQITYPANYTNVNVAGDLRFPINVFNEPTTSNISNIPAAPVNTVIDAGVVTATLYHASANSGYQNAAGVSYTYDVRVQLTVTSPVTVSTSSFTVTMTNSYLLSSPSLPMLNSQFNTNLTQFVTLPPFPTLNIKSSVIASNNTSAIITPSNANLINYYGVVGSATLGSGFPVGGLTSAYFNSFAASSISNIYGSNIVRCLMLVYNSGSGPASNITITNNLPAGNTYDSSFTPFAYLQNGTTSIPISQSGSVFTINTATIPSGSIAIIVYQISVAVTAGTYSISSTLTSYQSSTGTTYTGGSSSFNLIAIAIPFTISIAQLSLTNITEQIDGSFSGTATYGVTIGVPSLASGTITSIVSRAYSTLSFPVTTTVAGLNLISDVPTWTTVTTTAGTQNTTNWRVTLNGFNAGAGGTITYQFSATINSAVINNASDKLFNIQLLTGSTVLATGTPITYAFNYPLITLTKVASMGNNQSLVQYQFTIDNDGTSTAYDATLIDTLDSIFVLPFTVTSNPAGLPNVPSTLNSYNINWNLGMIPANTSYDIFVVGTLPSTYESGTVITNDNAVVRYGSIVNDPNPANSLPYDTTAAEYSLDPVYTISIQNMTYDHVELPNIFGGAIGDVIRYTNTISIPVGVTNLSSIVYDFNNMPWLIPSVGSGTTIGTIAIIPSTASSMDPLIAATIIDAGDPFSMVVTYNSSNIITLTANVSITNTMGVPVDYMWTMDFRIANNINNIAGLHYQPSIQLYYSGGSISPTGNFDFYVVEPNLSITQSNPAGIGNNLTYTLTATNNVVGNYTSTAFQVMVIDQPLSAFSAGNMTLITGIVGDWTAATLKYIGSQLLPGATATFGVTLTPMGGGIFTNTATITGRSVSTSLNDTMFSRTGVDGYDGLNNYYGTSSTNFALASTSNALSINKYLSGGTLVAGGTITYKIVIMNVGTEAYTGDITLSDIVPDGTTWNNEDGWTLNGTSLSQVLTLNNFPIGSTQIYPVTFNINDPLVSNVIINTSTINNGISDIDSITIGVPLPGVGPEGPPGPQGEQGEAGKDGLPGTPGAQGPQGPVGAQGEQGIQGPAGADGQPGVAGQQGEQGPQGIQGEPGAQGQQGEQGIQGEPGAQGIQGPAGADGQTGVPGQQGIQGPPGPPGPPGQNSCCPCAPYQYFSSCRRKHQCKNNSLMKDLR